MSKVAPNDPRSPARLDERDARLKAALKANLARRKAQARGRAVEDVGDNEAPLRGQDEG